MKKCSNCEKNNKESNAFCTKCGAKLDQETLGNRRSKHVNNKRSIEIIILMVLVVLIVVILAFVLGTHQNANNQSVTESSFLSEKVDSSDKTNESSQESLSETQSSSSMTNKDELDVNDLTPKQMAALVAYHGSTIGNNNWQAWGTYQDAMNNGVTSTNQIYVLNQSQCPVSISQPGNGKIYSYTDQGGIQNFYTLGNDGKTVYIYCFEQDENGDDGTQQPAETTTLQDMVNQANANLMTSEIKNVANTINIKDCE